MINGRTRLHVVANGTMTGQRYIDVLLPHVRLFRGAVGDKFVFMDDNATCHRTFAVQDCLDSEGAVVPKDGETYHTARATIDLLKDTFGDRLISRFRPVNWPPRSCDLTLLDYFLWGYVKSLVYADKPQTLNHLEDNIRRLIADIRPQMLEKVMENWTPRLDYIRASRGSPMTEIIFKM
ncbi:putative transposable element [Trichonephila clavipes]|nr:putative transposable element [Trichonephila clavipes]